MKMAAFALSLIVFGAASALAETPPANMAEMTARFHTQIEPCLNLDGLHARWPLQIAVRIRMDNDGQPIANGISLQQARPNNQVAKDVFLKLRSAIINCGKSGFAPPPEMAGQPFTMNVPFNIWLETTPVTPPPPDRR